MRKLEHLQEDEQGKLFRKDGKPFPNNYAYKVSRIKTLTMKTDCKTQEVIDALTRSNSAFIPKDANAYIASDFNRCTDHLRGEDAYTVLAFQFYNLAIYTSE